ncbi:hypothetical protein K1T71_010274 [Dendrolimus kikuchii]|uniref:Uncharacterized protein n=1 Tax=Dendrolimus kikuchii TaxID=765133 RepID=A0ACC1CR42_9NEOP|nr:hypothetical protein K1T71_010274 [Dendrolimus kikuchii]
MSLLFNSLIKKSLCFNKHFLTPCRVFNITQAKYLYSHSSMGIDNYLQTRKKVKEQFAPFADKFRLKMGSFVADPKNMIFTEDLKNMVHMAEPADIQLVLDMIIKFNSQNTEYRFGSFVFGPVVMRMFYFLDAPKEALQCFNEPVNAGFFDQLVSVQILLDLLYSHEMYDDMYKVFDRVQEKQINMTKFPKYPVVLVLAACYKQNTPQSFEYASKLWSEMSSVGSQPLRRATTFFAALALKQGAPHIALESLSTQKQHYVTIRNIKATALANMGRVDDALPVLRAVLEIDAPNQMDKHTFFNETIASVREAVTKSNNKDIEREFKNIEKAFSDRGLIENKTLDQLLNAEITMSPRQKDQPRGMPAFHGKRPFGQREQRRPNY